MGRDATTFLWLLAIGIAAVVVVNVAQLNAAEASNNADMGGQDFGVANAPGTWS